MEITKEEKEEFYEFARKEPEILADFLIKIIGTIGNIAEELHEQIGESMEDPNEASTK